MPAMAGVSKEGLYAWLPVLHALLWTVLELGVLRLDLLIDKSL